MSEYHDKRARDIFKSILYATIATADRNGKPWNSPVAFFSDGVGNVYWFSAKDSMHSSNIRSNENIFIVIYDSTMPEGTGEGLYIEAKAHELHKSKEINEVVSLQTGLMRVGANQVSGDALHRFYKATPVRIWMNDDEKDKDGNYLRDIRVDIELSQLTR